MSKAILATSRVSRKTDDKCVGSRITTYPDGSREPVIYVAFRRDEFGKIRREALHAMGVQT